MIPRLKVLVIDDDPYVLRTVSTILTEQGYDVATAKDGRRGVESFRATAPNLVLVDVLMPEMDGIETIRAIRGAGYGGRIIVMTGGGSRLPAAELVRMTLPLGADAALCKPFDAKQLLSVLNCPIAGPPMFRKGDR